MRAYEQGMDMMMQSKGYNTRLRNMDNNNEVDNLATSYNVNAVR